MKTLKGVSAAAGIVKGLVCVYSTETDTPVPYYFIKKTSLKNELDRCQFAFETSREKMRTMINNARSKSGPDAADILSAHLAMLCDDNLYTKVTGLISSKLINTEHAISSVFDEYIEKYHSQTGHFGELIHDFIDTRNRLLETLGTGTGKFKCSIGCDTAVIIAAKRLTPSMVLQIPRERVLAFITEKGGFTSHATILARSYGVPIIFGITNVEKELNCGSKVIVDGSLGKVVIAPDTETESYYDKKMETIQKQKYICGINKELATQTKTGIRIFLKLNISTPDEFGFAKELNHEGIGLLRTEFLFTGRKTPPSEDEQFELYSKVFSKETKNTITVRLLDIGPDKMPSYLSLPSDIAPGAELRGALAVETFPKLYTSQIKALLRANKNSNLRILYPMVSDLNDLKVFRSILQSSIRDLTKEKKTFDVNSVLEGVMIETPGAVMMIQEILKQVDFVNIGSNDLLQYTLASTRGNIASEKRYHICHPALIKLIKVVADAALKQGKEACLCGEIAAFEEFYPILLTLGLRYFSVTPSKFNDIKCKLLHLDTKNFNKMLDDYYSSVSREDIEKYFEKFI
ncbi:MAG TPA: phosphoenolpyruvate--protein phosphotransferase [Candidatus Omnitrophota bacterium]|nr:phosphoenolpyruvate--protein phosphotransferase [Candidatus Omnitrophota bacterium]HPS19767.1 phosphoenolpyruvate--protein phosphotransferase [Candidatus Omnitrophota bacterium]